MDEKSGNTKVGTILTVMILICSGLTIFIHPIINPNLAAAESTWNQTSENDFQNGTLLIKKPGIYRLQENIIFNPNESNDFSPTPEQISSGLYPENMSGPYHLGFFAAITVETENVIIDLNGFTIKQSDLHKLQQRFYANIELANSPFIPNQGPSAFIGVGGYRAANRVLVMNGASSSTSHHGIHSNTANNVVLHNLTFNNFEVAGIALNGTTNAVFNNNEVFIVEDGKLAKREINILKINETTLIFNGLDENTDIVVEPLINAVENTEVEIAR